MKGTTIKVQEKSVINPAIENEAMESAIKTLLEETVVKLKATIEEKFEEFLSISCVENTIKKAKDHETKKELLKETTVRFTKANQPNRQQTKPWKQTFITMLIFLAIWIHNKNKPTMDPPSNFNPLMSVNAMASYTGNMWKHLESRNKEVTLPPETNQEQVQRPNNVKTHSANTILNKVTRYMKPKYITMQHGP